MNKQLKVTLQKAGFSPKQSAVYLALLSLGEATVQEIGRLSGEKRTTVYTILDELKARGQVYKTVVNRRTYYAAERPDVVLADLRKGIDTMTDALPALNALRGEAGEKPHALFLEGSVGFRKIWHIIFRSNIREYQIITDPREMLHFVRKGYITNSIIKEKMRLGIKSQQIISSSHYAREILAKDAKENRVSKVLPDKYQIPYTTIIFGNNVAFISPFIQSMLLVIESETFAATEKAKFQALWDMLK